MGSSAGKWGKRDAEVNQSSRAVSAGRRFLHSWGYGELPLSPSFPVQQTAHARLGAPPTRLESRAKLWSPLLLLNVCAVAYRLSGVLGDKLEVCHPSGRDRTERNHCRQIRCAGAGGAGSDRARGNRIQGRPDCNVLCQSGRATRPSWHAQRSGGVSRGASRWRWRGIGRSARLSA